MSYLEKMPLVIDTFSVIARRKNENLGKGKLQAVHTIVPNTVDSTTIEFNHSLRYFDKLQTLQGHQTWDSELNLTTKSKPIVHVRINQMTSEGDYRLGQLMHGFYSLFLKQAETTLNHKKLPYIFQSTVEALSFHINLKAKLLKSTELGQANQSFLKNKGFKNDIDLKNSQKAFLLCRKSTTRQQSIQNLATTKRMIPTSANLVDNVLFFSSSARIRLERRFLTALVLPKQLRHPRNTTIL